MAPVRLEPAAPRSRVKHSTTEPLRSPFLLSAFRSNCSVFCCTFAINFMTFKSLQKASQLSLFQCSGGSGVPKAFYRIRTLDWGYGKKPCFLAHLSRRLMGELIVYQSLRRPSVVCRLSSVRPSVRPQFQTSSSLKPLGQFNSNFIWRLLRTRERNFVQMVLVT